MRHPERGRQFVRVTGAGEALVDRTQVGTEVFADPQQALEAVRRHRRH